MPTYDYQCKACEHRFEQFQSITAAPIRKCPKCKKNKVQRLISTGAGLIFKGSGFYITDYRSEGYKNAAKAESGTTPAAGESKPAGDAQPKAADAQPKKETKPAEKSTPKTADKPAKKSKD